MTTAPSRPPVKLRSFSRSLPMTLLLAREAVMARFRVSLNQFNITEQQWRVLRALSATSALEVTELARATSLLPPSLSRILRDMEARGLVERSQAPDDLRRALISVSPQGLRLIEAVAPFSEGVYAEIEAAFGAERMEVLQRLLRELTEALAALPPASYPEEVQRSGGRRRGRPRADAGTP